MEDKNLSVEQVNRAVGILNDRSVTISLFGKEIHVKPPTVGTIEEACRYLALLPKEKVEESDQHLLAKLVEFAPQTQPMYYAVAVMLYGERKCNQKQFWLFGRQNVELYARRLRSKCTPAEIRNALLTLLGSQVCGDFFGLVSAVMSALIVETK
jgi:hypothetical protein